MTALRVAIIGAAGQVGSCVLQALSTMPSVKAVGVCRNALAAGPVRESGLDVRVGDVARHPEIVRDCDVLVNCALSTATPSRAARENGGILSALAGAAGGRTVVHLSSVAVYGSVVDGQRANFDHPRPNTLYGHQKLGHEAFIQALGRSSKDVRLFVLRMGHVYGTLQWVSREAVSRLAVPGVALPFDGERPSNAVHVSNVATAIVAVASGSADGRTLNLLDSPQKTWRQIYDWHSAATGLPRAGAMSREESEALRSYHLALAAPLYRRMPRDAFDVVRALPSLIAQAPSVRDVGGRLLSRFASSPSELKLKAAMLRRRASERQEPSWGPHMVSDGVPGPALEYPANGLTTEARALASWFAVLSSPDAILRITGRAR